MKTDFPSQPRQVAPLAPDEFRFDTATIAAPCLDEVCGRFPDDPNRALVWLIRLGALKTLRERTDMADWFGDAAHTSRDICEIAAKLELNDRWEFEAERFCSAVDAMVSRRSRWRLL